MAYPETPGVENNPAPQAVDASPCCGELIRQGYLPVPDCCRSLEELNKPGTPF